MSRKTTLPVHRSGPVLPQPGDRVGNFEVVELLGRGGMGAVFRAVDCVLDRPVAIKFLTISAGSMSASMQQRFVREAQLMARVTHPHIVPIYAASLEEAHPYFVMEFVAGETLDAYLGRDPRPQVGITCSIGAQITSALAFAWESHSVIHRDLKPENVIFTSPRHVKILDLGIAKCLEEEVDMELTTIQPGGHGIGTPYYASPEQFVGDADVDHRSDIYSLGLMLYEMVAGQPVFDAEADLNVLLAHKLTGPRISLEGLTGVPSRLRQLLQNMIALDPAKRVDNYAVVEDVLAETGQRFAESTVVLPPPRDTGARISMPTHVHHEMPTPPTELISGTDALTVIAGDPLAHGVDAQSTADSEYTDDMETQVLPQTRRLLAQIGEGLRLADYQVGARLGLGGLGVVHRGLHLPSNTPVAMKFLIDDDAAERETVSLDNFRTQADRLQALQHPCIVQVRDCLRQDDLDVVVTDLFVGPNGHPVNLEDYARAFGDATGLLAPAELRLVLINVLDALQHAHDHDIVHGNLKPQNILFQSVGDAESHWSATVQLTDFGVTDLVGDEVFMCSVQMSMDRRKAGGGAAVTPDVQALLRSFDFMSPEQRRGDGPTAAGDIYGAGLLAYRYLTGLTEPGAGQLPTAIRPGIDPGWDRVVASALQDDPEDRFPAAVDMGLAVAAITV
jgi:serine/threonine protein kinase